MKGITQHGLLPILGIVFKVGLLVVTAINTYGILYAISQDNLWAAAALILFEGGLIYWWLVFKNDTESSVVQMAISLIMFITCLLLVAAANALHLGAISPDMLGEGTIEKVVIMAVVIQLAASLIYPMVSQEHLSALMTRIAIGLVWARAQSNVMNNLDHLAEQTQTEIEGRMWRTIQSSINQTANSRLLGEQGQRAHVVIEGQTTDTAPAPRRSWRDRLFNRPAAPIPVVVNSTQDIPTAELKPDAPDAAPGKGPDAVKLPDGFHAWPDAAKLAWLEEQHSGTPRP